MIGECLARAFFPLVLGVLVGSWATSGVDRFGDAVLELRSEDHEARRTALGVLYRESQRAASEVRRLIAECDDPDCDAEECAQQISELWRVR